MSNVTSQGLINILLGTELGGNAKLQYVVSFAVPNKLLGKSKDGNSSGFSFGVVQLDIANNSFAAKAYKEILDGAMAAGTISQDQHTQFMRYSGKQRPDLDPALSSAYSDDRKTLTGTVFSTSAAHGIIDKYTLDYVSGSLHPSVDKFLDAVAAKWGPDTVFSTQNADFYTAVAAMTSISNRTGGLNGSTKYFVNLPSAPNALSDVKKRYDSVLGDHWSLVLKGAETYKAGGVL
jgi:hypothetical protein